MDSAKSDMRIFSGIAASPGIAVGRLRIIDRCRLSVDEYDIAKEDVAAEIDRLKDAITRTREELESLKGQLQKNTGDEHLFFIDTHLMILVDERLINEAAA